MGVKLMNLPPDDRIVDSAIVRPSQDDGQEEVPNGDTEDGPEEGESI